MDIWVIISVIYYHSIENIPRNSTITREDNKMNNEINIANVFKKLGATIADLTVENAILKTNLEELVAEISKLKREKQEVENADK